MKINYKKKIKGLCYVEDVFDKNGNKVAKILFDNNCNLIDEANAYLRELRITRLTSFNSVNVVARDLCHLYNFLIVSNKKIEEIDYEFLSEFINYLTKISSNKKRFSIENTMLTRLSLNTHSSDNNVISIRKFGSIANSSILRIFCRATYYLEYLNVIGINVDERILQNLKLDKAKTRFVQANGVSVNTDRMRLNIEDQIISDEQLERINEGASKTNDYQRLLYFILSNTGMRIGEVLGLQIIKFSDDIKNLEGDICYENGAWKINVVYRHDNYHDSLAKSHAPRSVSIRESSRFEFELLLERYLKFRKRKLGNKKVKWFFISNRATKLTQNTAYKRFKRTLGEVCPELIDRVTLHSYRHSFCTKEILAGTPLELVAKIVGHESPATTYRIYVHYSGEDMKEIRKKHSHYMTKKNKGGGK